MSSIKKLDKNQLKTVTCPKQLYQLIEASNDPESFYVSYLFNVELKVINLYTLEYVKFITKILTCGV